MEGGWIGVDLDGTLAHYDEWRGAEHIGEPIAPMCKRVKEWLAAGETVKVFTARASLGDYIVETIRDWCLQAVGERLDVTDRKDLKMIELWDDRAIRVEKNTGVMAVTQPAECQHVGLRRVAQCSDCGAIRPFDWGEPKAEIVVVTKETLGERVVSQAEFRELTITDEIYIDFRAVDHSGKGLAK